MLKKTLQTIATYFALGLTSLTLLGCGQRGPLYLPKPPAPLKQPAQANPSTIDTESAPTNTPTP